MQLTGVPREVNHIVPLNSDLVCGLHWEGNRQVTPAAAANLAKRNDWRPDIPARVRPCRVRRQPSLRCREKTNSPPKKHHNLLGIFPSILHCALNRTRISRYNAHINTTYVKE